VATDKKTSTDKWFDREMGKQKKSLEKVNKGISSLFATLPKKSKKSVAETVVDALLDENWFRDRWEDVKAATGIGSDETGLKRNTEKGWRPKYGPTGTLVMHKNLKPGRQSSLRDVQPKVFKLD